MFRFPQFLTQIHLLLITWKHQDDHKKTILIMASLNNVGRYGDWLHLLYTVYEVALM